MASDDSGTLRNARAQLGGPMSGSPWITWKLTIRIRWTGRGRSARPKATKKPREPMFTGFEDGSEALGWSMTSWGGWSVMGAPGSGTVYLGEQGLDADAAERGR